tara:strand:- start:151 stop:375 length:225 start_codon:yes stop_codon:yes gene_type:complete
LPALGRTISPTPENVISQPLITVFPVTRGDVSLYRSRITLLSGVAHTPEDGVTAISVWIIRRKALAPETWRLRL